MHVRVEFGNKFPVSLQPLSQSHQDQEEDETQMVRGLRRRTPTCRCSARWSKTALCSLYLQARFDVRTARSAKSGAWPWPRSFRASGTRGSTRSFLRRRP